MSPIPGSTLYFDTSCCSVVNLQFNLENIFFALTSCIARMHLSVGCNSWSAVTKSLSTLLAYTATNRASSPALPRLDVAAH